MGLKIGDTTCFERARTLAQQIVEEGGGGDGFSVVLMSAPPRRIVPEPSEDARKVAAELRNLRLTHGNADLAGTLATVASLLKASPGKFPTKEVYFFTDMQRSGWISARPGDLATALQTFQETKAKAVFLDVGQEGVSNLAVVGLEMGDPVATTASETRILGTLLNHGDTREDVPVRLLVGRARTQAGDKPLSLREVASTSVRARRNQLTPVAFTYKFPTPGDYVVQVQAGHDALELDDTRSAVVRVRNTVPVMLVNGKPAPEAFDRAAEWLRVALNPYDEGERIPAAITARPKVLTQFDFADETRGDLTNYDAVFLCDVPRFSPAEVRRLESHVRRGGAVVFCLGGRVDLGAYNDALYRDGNGLLPAPPDRLRRRRKGLYLPVHHRPGGGSARSAAALPGFRRPRTLADAAVHEVRPDRANPGGARHFAASRAWLRGRPPARPAGHRPRDAEALQRRRHPRMAAAAAPGKRRSTKDEGQRKRGGNCSSFGVPFPRPGSPHHHHGEFRLGQLAHLAGLPAADAGDLALRRFRAIARAGASGRRAHRNLPADCGHWGRGRG